MSLRNRRKRAAKSTDKRLTAQIAAPVTVIHEHPEGGAEFNNDAMSIVNVVRTMVRAAGADPRDISGYDAWKAYVVLWKDGVVRSGQQMSANWERLMSYDGLMGQHFQRIWESNNVLAGGPGLVLTSGLAPGIVTGGRLYGPKDTT